MRFQKRIKIAPGVKLNVSTKGVSTTVGTRGASVNVGKKGVYANTGIPGTGISSRKKIAGGKKAERQTDAPTGGGVGNFFLGLGVLAVIGFLVWLL